MFNLMQTQQVLQEKQKLLLCFEEVTQNMLSCPASQLEDQVRERQKLIGLIDQLDQKLQLLCGKSREGELLLGVLAGKGEVSSLPEGVRELYGDALAIRSVLSRLQESDIQAALRLRVEQEKILKQIKATNQGPTAKAARFYSGSAAQGTISKLGKA